MRLVFVGLLTFLAFSTAAAWGRQPPKEEEVEISLRRMSACEIAAIVQEFPELATDRFDSEQNDTGSLRDTLPSGELTAAPLQRVFPDVQFYKDIHNFSIQGRPSVAALVGGKRYIMLGEFARLLSEKGLSVTDDNKVELAKAFVVLVVGSQEDSFPQTIFLEGRMTKQALSGMSVDGLGVRTGELESKWYFDVFHSQFVRVWRKNSWGAFEDCMPEYLPWPMR